MDDAELAGYLAGCAAGCPVPGSWQDAPFAERVVDGVRYAVLALDPGVTAFGLRRIDGSLWLLPEGSEPRLVNFTLEAFVAFARIYREAAAEADAYEGPRTDGDEGAEEAMQAADALTDAVLERFSAVDAAAVDDENSFWHIAAEELGYGMSV